jgi:hypothetical protein
MPAGELLGIGLEKSNGDRGALGDDREEMASGEGEEEAVFFADG